MTILRLTRVFTAALCALLFCAPASLFGAEKGAAVVPTPPPAARKPSILFIMADDLGYGDLGCYGQTKLKTPNIDKLAAEGVRFTQFYAGSTVCAPSRSALMTGQHTGHTWIRGNANVPLRPADRTLAEVLKDAGYLTALIGKWGLGEPDSTGVPQRQGFDHFIGYLNQTHAHDYYTDYLWRVDPQTGYEGQSKFPENSAGEKKIYMPDVFTTAALNFIRAHKPDRLNRHRPFFLFLSYTIPHANNEETRRSGNGMQVPSDVPYNTEPWPQPERNKAAMITRMDSDIGRIMEQLRQYGLDNNTIIFFTSDNGPHKEGGNDPKFFRSSGPFRGIKRDLYEGGIRVPMIVRWPDGLKPGMVSDQVWAMWDVLPTAAEIAGVKPPARIDGISMLPAITGRPQTNQHEFLYWEFHERGSHQAARKGDWKAVVPAGKPLELYNLAKDPGETNNIASAEADLVRTFTEYLKTARTESEHWPMKKPDGKQ